MRDTSNISPMSIYGCMSGVRMTHMSQRWSWYAPPHQPWDTIFFIFHTVDQISHSPHSAYGFTVSLPTLGFKKAFPQSKKYYITGKYIYQILFCVLGSSSKIIRGSQVHAELSSSYGKGKFTGVGSNSYMKKILECHLSTDLEQILSMFLISVFQHLKWTQYHLSWRVLVIQLVQTILSSNND